MSRVPRLEDLGVKSIAARDSIFKETIRVQKLSGPQSLLSSLEFCEHIFGIHDTRTPSRLTVCQNEACRSRSKSRSSRVYTRIEGTTSVQMARV